MSLTGHNLRRRMMMRASDQPQEASSGESSEASPDADVPEKTANLYATHRGAGRYRVTDGEGNVVEDSVSRSRVEAMGAERA